MNVYELLKKMELVDDVKEFLDLTCVRAIKLDGKFIVDPNISTSGAKSLKVGILEIEL